MRRSLTAMLVVAGLMVAACSSSSAPTPVVIYVTPVPTASPASVPDEAPTRTPVPSTDLASNVLAYFDETIALGEKCVAMWKAKDVAGLAETTCMGDGLLINDENTLVLARLLEGPAPAGYGEFALAARDADVTLRAFTVNIVFGSQYLRDGYGPGKDAEPEWRLSAFKAAVTTLRAVRP